MTRPNFFIVGAPKCGTTAWHHYLQSHPEITFASVKEPHYFNTDMDGYRWARTESEYLSLFAECAGTSIVGEASVHYLGSETAAKNIADFAPEARIIIFVRDPVTFLVSYHNQLLVNLDEDISSFIEAWNAGKNRVIPTTCREPKLLDYRSAGCFGEQIERYMNYFPSKQIKIVQFEEWIENPNVTYLELLTFLGLENRGQPEFLKVHGAKKVASKKIMTLTQRPPDAALVVAKKIRDVLGIKRLGWANKLRKFNLKSVDLERPDSELSNEICSYYLADQQKIKYWIEQLKAIGATG